MPDIDSAVASSPQSEREATYLACWVVAFCDGRLWREKRVLEDIAAELQLPKKIARNIEKSARRGKRDFDEPTTEAGRRVMYHFTLKTAAADGKLDDDELQFARKFGRHLGLTDDEIEAEFQTLIPEKKRSAPRRASQSPQSVQDGDSLNSLVEGMRSNAATAGKLHQFSTYVLPFLLMVIAHVVPVIGALFWGWDIPTILLIYWGENVIVGIFNAFKLRLALPGESMEPPGREAEFFCLHYGGFTLAHGAFILIMTGTWLEEQSFSGWLVWFASNLPGILLALALIAVEQGYAFSEFVREEEYKRTTKDDLFLRPYSRIIALHVTIIFGGGFATQFGYERAIPVLIMIGLHLFIETLIWNFHLPDWGFLGGIRKVVGGAVGGGVIALVPLAAISVVGGIAVGVLANLVVSVFPELRPLSEGVSLARFVPWAVSTFCLTIVSAAGLGALIGLFDHLGKVDSDKLAESLRVEKRFVHYLAGLVALAGIVSALVPFEQILPKPNASGTKERPIVVRQTSPPTKTREQRARQSERYRAHRMGSNVNLMRSARVSASSVHATGGRTEIFSVENVIDGDRSTVWRSAAQPDESPRQEWLAAHWEQPVKISRIAIYERHDRIVDFAIQRFDTDAQEWIHVMVVFGNKHYCAYSKTGQPPWSARFEQCDVDGKPLWDQKQRQFGDDPGGNEHPVFSLYLPHSLETTALRFLVTKPDGRYRQQYEICEFEVY